MKKKMISLLLVFALMCPFITVSASANNIIANETMPLVTEVNGVRTAVVVENMVEYTAVYDQNNNTVSISARDLRTGVVNSSGSISTEKDFEIATLAVTISQDTESGFYYEINTGTQYEWELQRPKLEGEGTGRYYFKVWENGSNSEYLDDFEKAVDDLAQKETDLAAETTKAQLTAFAGGLMGAFALVAGGAVLAGGAIAAIIAAFDLTGEAAKAAEAVALQCNTCLKAIEDVFYNTDNMHY